MKRRITHTLSASLTLHAWASQHRGVGGIALEELGQLIEVARILDGRSRPQLTCGY